MNLVTKRERKRLEAGDVLDDRFKIVGYLGGGSFGDVYEARQLVLGRPLRTVALKLFDAGKVTAANVHEVFSDAITLFGLQEESADPVIARHLIQVYDIGLLKSPESCYMAMRLVPGRRTLDDEIQRYSPPRDDPYAPGGMSIPVALRYMRQIVIPLEWMHGLETAIVHGDLKPDNVLLAEGDILVLTDFGLAAGMPLGSLGGAVSYQAPENLLGETADPAADVYALGLIFYELLTGRHPFRDVGLEQWSRDDSHGYIRAHQDARKWKLRAANTLHPADDRERIPSPVEFNPDLADHPQLIAILEKSLTWTRAKRYQNAGMLWRDLDQYLKTGEVADLHIVHDEQDSKSTKVAEPWPGAKSPAARIKDAELLLGAGKAQDALQILERALSEQPGFVPGLLIQARAYSALNRFDLARECCAQAQQLAPELPEVLETLADVFEVAGKQALSLAMRQQAQSKRSQGGKKG